MVLEQRGEPPVTEVKNLRGTSPKGVGLGKGQGNKLKRAPGGACRSKGTVRTLMKKP